MNKNLIIQTTTKHAFNKQPILFFCLLFLISVLQSCDPARILQIRTSNKPNYSVAIYANRNILPFENDRQNEKFILKIPTNDAIPKTDTTFHYGIGGWPDKDKMREFSKNIDSIIIIRNGVKLSLKNQNDITEYLLKQRHGFGKSILTIEAK